MAILFLIVGLAAVLFPYRRKDIFDASPDLVRRKVGGIPVIVILGVLTIVSSLFIGYAVFLPQFSGPFILNNFLLLIAVLVSPVIIYAASYYYYKSKGILWPSRKRKFLPNKNQSGGINDPALLTSHFTDTLLEVRVEDGNIS